MTVDAILRDELPAAVELRRRLHAVPELGHQEHATGELIAAALDGEVERPLGSTLMARGPGDGPAVILRAELDGLPISERTGVEWSSRNGAMHACGHDVHMAALVAVIRTLRRAGTASHAPAVALFQPSEESHPLGAEMIVERGMLPPARAVLAVHVHPELPWRSVIAPAGPVNASCDFITLTIHGIGGHAAYPHRTRDPVLALSATIVAAQQLISRRTDPLRPAVIALTCLEAGTVENIVPDIAQARGTLRALEPSDRHRLASELQDLVHGIAAAHGCRAELEVRLGEPTLVNDARLAEAVKPRLEAFGFTTDGDFRSCGSDDFSFYGSVAPTLMLFAGLDGSPGFQPRALHDAAFLPPDAAVEVVAQSYLAAYLSVWASIT